MAISTLIVVRLLLNTALSAFAVYNYASGTYRADDVPLSRKAFVLSFNDTRWTTLSSVLNSAGFVVDRLWPVSAQEPSLRTIGGIRPGASGDVEARTLSIALSMRYLWAAVAAGTVDVPGNGYVLVFEDDAALHESIDPSKVLDIAHEAAKASYHTGQFFLGLACYVHCSLNPEGSARVPPGTFSWTKDGIGYARCNGITNHAYGIFKWRTEWYFDALRAAALRGGIYPESNEDRSLRRDNKLALDMHFLHYHGKETHVSQQPVLAGFDLRDHEPEHCGDYEDADLGVGVFYQAISRYASQRNGKTAMKDVARSVSRPAVSGQGYMLLRAPAEPAQLDTPLRPLDTIFLLTTSSSQTTDVVPAPVLRVVGVGRVVLNPTLGRIWGDLYGVGTAPWTGPNLYDTLAHTYTHRRAWQMIAVDTQLQDEDYVLVLEDGVALGAAEAEHERAAIHDLAQRSRRAGLFYLSTCGQDRQTTWQSTLGGVHRIASNCTRAYGIFKWRAAWLWDVLQAVLEDDPAFQSSIHNRVSIGAHLQHGLPKLLPPGDLPLAPSAVLL